MNWIIVFISLICSSYQSLSGTEQTPLFTNFYHHDAKSNDNYLNDVSPEDWMRFVQYGTDSVNRRLRLEENLLAAKITVENGSISHAQLLDTLPEGTSLDDNEIAKKMLKASQFAYDSKCAAFNRRGPQCVSVLENKPLPAGTDLLQSCIRILSERRDGHYPFRRLLPKNYKDGLYEMFSEDKLPSPRTISSEALKQSSQSARNELFSDKENLVLVQWTQFIEHDLSKPVVTSMSNGYAIECCNKNNYKLSPRYYHPACSPLLSNQENSQGPQSCLNYVRSALTVGSECNFATVEQVNHATGFLDLSQLYGFTVEDQRSMRLFKNGKLKSRKVSDDPNEDLLPTPHADDVHEFCVFNANPIQNVNFTCFMAGDSRVNNNPFAVIIYTIFMRNHNQIAQELHSQHNDWTDEHLFRSAKAINIEIYRHIIFEEWLPAVLGQTLNNKIKSVAIDRNKRSNEVLHDHIQISNEFAVAAMRFYFSMMPNALKRAPIAGSNSAAETLFVVKDQLYKPQAVDKPVSFNTILESLLHQRAMKVDSIYEDSFVLRANSHATHADILAIDIQRGRDHGLQSYAKYLEACAKLKINNWEDLKRFIDEKHINHWKTLYKNYTDVDLLVGGIAEIPQNDSLLGPTFSCILAEQFDQIQQAHQYAARTPTVDLVDTKHFKTMTAFDVLCSNSNLSHVPKNIFHQVSKRNKLIPCTR